MMDLVVAEDDFDALRAQLLGGAAEGCAVLFTARTRRDDGLVRLLVRETLIAAAADYSVRETLKAELTPAFVARTSKYANRCGYGLVFVHSHVGAGVAEFSAVDDQGERLLREFLEARYSGGLHVALLMTEGSVSARVLGRREAVRVVVLGKTRVVYAPTPSPVSGSAAFDRQVRAFGREGQRALEALRVGIVGVGGTGSLVSQFLVHLGVRDFILVDPDVVEVTNLNRIAGASTSDVGDAKVDVSARHLRRFSSAVNVIPLKRNVVDLAAAQALLNADVLFGCTDSHGSRAILQQVSYQYLIPCIDMGVNITVHEGRLTHIFGRVQLLSPGLACLTCSNLLDAEEVRRDMLSDAERRLDPYIQGAHEPAPSVMSINGTVSSLAVTVFLSLITGQPTTARHMLYDAIASKLRTVRVTPNPQCFVCSPNGYLARGDARPISARQ